MQTCFRAAVLVFTLAATAAAQDMDLTGVLLDGEDWELVSSGHQFTEGPAGDADGNVFFTDVPASKIFRIDAASGKVSLFVENSAKTNGLMFGPDGLLYGCRNGNDRIVSYDKNGKATTIAEGVKSNDIVVLADRSIYFTDPPNGQVWHINPAGEKRVVAKNLRPNGIIAWSGGGTLIVTDGSEPHLWTFRIEKDGSLTHKDRYYGPLTLQSGQDRPGSDGMTIDAAGRLYVSTRVGLQMFDTTGRKGGVILKPQRAFLSNAVFGGAKFDTLYVTCTDKVYKRKTKTRGIRYTAAKTKR